MHGWLHITESVLICFFFFLSFFFCSQVQKRVGVLLFNVVSGQQGWGGETSAVNNAVIHP